MDGRIEREEQEPAPDGARSDHLGRLRLLVTLQNQIVELARCNQMAQQTCARLSEEIVEQAAGRKKGCGGIRRAVDFLRQWLIAVRRRPRAKASPQPNGRPAPHRQQLAGVASVRAGSPRDAGCVPSVGSGGAENKVEAVPSPALRSAVR